MKVSLFGIGLVIAVIIFASLFAIRTSMLQSEFEARPILTFKGIYLNGHLTDYLPLNTLVEICFELTQSARPVMVTVFMKKDLAWSFDTTIWSQDIEMKLGVNCVTFTSREPTGESLRGYVLGVDSEVRIREEVPFTRWVSS